MRHQRPPLRRRSLGAHGLRDLPGAPPPRRTLFPRSPRVNKPRAAPGAAPAAFCSPSPSGSPGTCPPATPLRRLPGRRKADWAGAPEGGLHLPACPAPCRRAPRPDSCRAPEDYRSRHAARPAPAGGLPCAPEDYASRRARLRGAALCKCRRRSRLGAPGRVGDRSAGPGRRGMSRPAARRRR